MPTAAVGIAEYPPLLGQASGVVIRRFGARESAFPSAELGRPCRVPENAARIAAKIQVWPSLEILREFRGTGPRAKASRASEPRASCEFRTEDCGTRAASLL
jgi:hypothetical protein